MTTLIMISTLFTKKRDNPWVFMY